MMGTNSGEAARIDRVRKPQVTPAVRGVAVLGLLLAAVIGSSGSGKRVAMAGGPAASLPEPVCVGGPVPVPGFARFVAAEGAPRLAVSEVQPRGPSVFEVRLAAVHLIDLGSDGLPERRQDVMRTRDVPGGDSRRFVPDAIHPVALAAHGNEYLAVGMSDNPYSGMGPNSAWWLLRGWQVDYSGSLRGARAPTYDRALMPSAAVDAALWGQRLVLAGEGGSRAAGSGVCVVVADWGEWSQWPKAAMALSHCSSPTITAVDGRGLFVSGNTSDPRALIYRPSPGLIRLAYSPDGVEWTELPPPPTWEKPHTSALAADSELGLFLVYTAEGWHDGWPVYAQRSPDFGQTWGRPLMLTSDTIHAVWPDATFYEGNLYVSYLEVPNEPSPEGEMFLQPPTGAYVMVVDAADIPVP